MNLSDFKDHFEQLRTDDPGSLIGQVRREGFHVLDKAGLPTKRNEEWKYTDMGKVFSHEYFFDSGLPACSLAPAEVDVIRLPGHDNANEIVFVNGRFEPQLSKIRSPQDQLTVLPLEDAASGTYKETIREYLGCSSAYIKDGIHALNTSFIHGAVFVHVHEEQELNRPLYIYHISDARQCHILSQPRSLIYVDRKAKVQLAETFATLGASECFTNQVTEVIIQNNAIVEYYKIQNETANASQVSTTHIRQIGCSKVHTVTVTLNGGMIRNNLNVIMEAAGNEAHLFGLYLLNGHTHADNHTLADHVQPNCLSNELYKGILDNDATGVFNGKIMVRPGAQKTNAYQTNKNILLSEDATINTKPQLEIFADDVKCSHGCTVGQLDENALFYLRARGIPKPDAQELLLKAFALDILDQIKPELLRSYVENLITERLSASKK
ncbi:Fe-S cluster assembly protein SufD [Mucilaginibacter sp.]|jgi:Fe-S cluster assembly protein SufD|uniref:Fe-S cluster assembly protein SufD n=1 Tax=Mucilaginibacter sp. TaxID=1882438 RepID=UPI002BFB7BCC|nr:Fe-S cluster assembly protein SufD [Mucilaginibacter sp.]HTI59014.1 Fe-S cluster assembly protein SufD [Mucilaginibacter sp.]